MSAVVRPAGLDDVDAICRLLHSKMNPRIALQRWRRLMTYTWFKDVPDFGRVVDADGVILGYCGMVYADRILGDSIPGRRKERMVSMSSWYLDKSLRGRGLGKQMLDDCTADPVLTYATLTNSRNPLSIVESCGFKILEDHRFVWRKSAAADSAIVIVRQFNDIYASVEPHEQRLINDMRAQPLTPILLQAAGAQTLLFFSIKPKAEDVIWFDLMYASDLALFASHAQVLANALLPDLSSVLAADGRFVPVAQDYAERQPLPVPRYFKSTRVAPQELDHLYSELQLLDLKLD